MKDLGRVFSASCIALAVLSGCGGSSSNSDTFNQPNTPPIAQSDSALTSNNQTITISVLDNDSDVDGNALTITSISIAPTHGTAEIIDNQISYIPNTNFAGVDTLTYELSDGQSTSSAEVDITLTQSLVISGVVTDGPISNAQVTTLINGETVSTEADVDGNFVLPLVITDSTAVISLQSLGNAENQQEHVELLGTLFNLEDLIAVAGEDRTLSPDEDIKANITQISTATTLLAQQINSNEGFDASSDFETALNIVSAEELLNTAAFIKLLVDNENYMPPEGQTLVEMLQSAEDGSVASAIDGFIGTNELIDPFFGLSQQYVQDLETAKLDTLGNVSNIANLPIDLIANKHVLLQSGDSNFDWINAQNDILVLQENGEGILNQADFGLPFHEPVTWNDSTDKLSINSEVVFNKMVVISSFHTASNPPEDLLFWGQEFRHQLFELLEDPSFMNPTGQYFYKQRFLERKYSVLARSQSHIKLAVETTEEREFIPLFSWPNEEINPIATKTVVKTLNLHIPDGETTIEDPTGKWSVPVFKSWTFSDLNDYDSIGQISLTLQEDGSLEGLEGFSWEASETGIQISSESEHFEIQPVLESGKEYLVLVSHYEGEELVREYTGRMAKFDDSLSTEDFATALTTELPEFYNSHLNSHLASSWQNDKLKSKAIFGFNIREDGSMSYAVRESQNSTDEQKDYRVIDNWSWEVAGEKVLMTKNGNHQIDQDRTWEVISINENGRILIQETLRIGFNFDDNFEVTEELMGLNVAPRINVITKENMQDWPEMWEFFQENPLGSSIKNNDTPELSPMSISNLQQYLQTTQSF